MGPIKPQHEHKRHLIYQRYQEYGQSSNLQLFSVLVLSL